MRTIVCLIAIASSVCGDDVSDAIRLLKSKDAHQIILGAQRIRSIGPRAKKATTRLVKQTGHESWQVRNECAKALMIIGADSAKRVLRALKSSRNPDQRAALASVVVKLGRDLTKYHEQIVPLLHDEDAGVRDLLVSALVKMSPECQPALINALGDRNERVRDAAGTTLGKIGTAALDALVGALESKEAVVRAGAANALGRIGPKAIRATRGLDTLRKDTDPSVRVAAVEAIGNIRGNGPHFIPILIALCEDPDVGVRRAAATAVAKFGPPAAPALSEALGGNAAPYAARALRKIGAKAQPALEAACESKDEMTRALACRILVDVSSNIKSTAHHISTLLQDESTVVRVAAARALAERGAQFAERDLLNAAEDANAGVRAAAVRALSQVKRTEPVQDAITAAQKDEDVRVRLAAETVRWASGEDSGIVALARKHLASADEGVRDAACRSLQPMGRGAADAIPELIAALETTPSPAIVDALGAIAAAHGNGLTGRAERFKRAPKPVRESIEQALAWLASCQDTKQRGANDADGRWHPTDFVKHFPEGAMSGPGGRLYSGGVTGLAASLYLAIGRFDDPALREGLEFLVRSQDGSGYLSDSRSQHFLIAHAFATQAMCEAWIVTGDPRYRRCAVRAIRACEAARNPGLGWRYEPQGAENDTNVSAAMLGALSMAERGGIAVDAGAFRGGARWIASCTDEEYGQIGYNVQGGSPARPAGLQDAFPPEHSQAMTAAGLWGMSVARRHAEKLPGCLDKAEKLCADLPPEWSGPRRDFYFWYYGTLVMHGIGGKRWSTWNRKLTTALIENQRREESAFAGSWDPVGPWGHDGGRVYMTAICGLMLATPIRFTAKFLDGKPGSEFATAIRALEQASRGDDPEVADRSALWLRRAGS